MLPCTACAAWVLWISAKVILYYFFTDYEKTKDLLKRTRVRLQLRKASLLLVAFSSFFATLNLLIFCQYAANTAKSSEKLI